MLCYKTLTSFKKLSRGACASGNMMLIFLITFALLFIRNTSGYKDCNDCLLITQCEPAIELVSKNKSPETEMLLRSAQCGYVKLPLVCCSDFEDDLEKHPNYNLLPSDCGVIQGNRIVGGQVAELYEFPWLVLIAYKENNKIEGFQCGGTLINSMYVLTAAHCVETKSNKEIAGVRIGEYDTNTLIDCVGEGISRICEGKRQNIGVNSSVYHPHSDIALLRLSRPADLTYVNAGTICLPVTRKLREKDISGENGVVAGWGKTETTQASNVPLKVEVPIFDNNTCAHYYGNEHSKYPVEICAGEKDRDSCKGDSGGPLMLQDEYDGIDKFIQFGIVSRGPLECGSERPGLYTDVRKYMKWILDNIKP